MATYQVQAPDGTVHLIQGPDNASPADIEAFAAKSIPATQTVAQRIASDPISMGAKNFAQDASPLSNFLAGAGKAVSDLGNGVRQIGAIAGIGDPAKVQADIDSAKQLDAPLLATRAGIAGDVAGNVAAIAIPGAGVARGAQALNAARVATAARAFVNPTTYAGAVGAGAATGAIQPVASDESRAINTVAGAAAGAGGQAIVNGLGRVAQPIKNALDPVRQKAIDTLQAAGVPLDLAQVTGSPVWGRIRSALGDNLFTMGGQAAKQADQQTAFNTAALKLIGADAPAATSDVMGAAQSRINGVFGDVLDRNTVKADPSWIGQLIDTHTAALENEKQPIANIVNRVFNSIDPQTGGISGQVAYGIKKDLDRMSMTSDTTQNYLARQARSALMDGINGSLSGADQQAFSQARGQASNMYKLEPAIAKDGSGDISPSILANTLAQKGNRSASIYGNGPQALVDLAQAGKQVLTDKTPNSGTTARVMAALLPGAVVAGGTQLATGDPLEAAKYGVGVFAAPKIAQFILNNPTTVKALSQGISPNAAGGLLGDAYNAAAPTVRGLLEAPAENASVGQLMRSSPLLATRLGLLPAAQQQSLQP